MAWIKHISHILRSCSTGAVFFIFCSATLFFITILTISNKGSISFSIQHTMRQSGMDERLMRPQPYTYGVDGPSDPRFYNIISENEALKFQPCQDIRKTASARNSNLSLADGSKGTYTIGETIRAVVSVNDDYGQPKNTGGDQLRATIENKMLSASAPCVVTDNRNGTHAVFCEALWGGDLVINIKLAYARETVTGMYRVRTKVLANRLSCGMFVNKKSTADTPCTPCHPNSTHLLMFSNHRHLCNLTRLNSGMPFFCGKPNNEHLTCGDLQLVKMQPCHDLPTTDCEKSLFKRGQVALKQTLKVKVVNTSKENKSSVIDKPDIPCSQYNVSLTWHSRRPTGFFHDGKWHLRNCLGVHQQYTSNMSCLQNRRLYMFGDSTLRQWYTAFLKRLNCLVTLEKNKKCPNCQQALQCVNNDINFQIGFYFHAQPTYLGEGWNAKHTWYSTSFRIDNIPRDERAIVVIHVYQHSVNFHHNVFRQRMEIIRNSVENYLSNTKHSVVMIKAPHTFEGPIGECRLHDYYGDVYSKILYEVFDGLHDRVILLNNRDATLAQHEKLNHPKDNIVNAMIDQMMSFLCD